MRSATNTSESDWLGGAPNSLALDVAGDRLTYRELAARIDAAPASPRQHRTARTDDAVGALVEVLAGFTRHEPVLVCDSSRPEPELADIPAGTGLMLTTSGSTGRPRVVARTLRSWQSSFAPFTTLTGLTSDDRVGITGPLHAGLHLFGTVHALALGATVTDDLPSTSALHCVPSMLDRLLRDGVRPRLVVVAGAALPAALADRAAGAGIAVVEYYGAAELSFVAARRYPHPLRAFNGVEVRVRDGELWAQSPYVAIGYAGIAGPLRRDLDGYATVGDLAELTEDGALVIRGRGDAAITTGGATVLAEDIEAALASLPGVLAAVVVGTPHERFGELVTALIEWGDPVPPTAADLRQLLAERLHTEAMPRRWFTGAIPRTGNGKPARQLVRDGLIDGSLPVRPLR